MSDIQVNDIVQIIDETHPWYPCLVVVDEIKSWGVQCYCHIPRDNTINDVVQAYNRLAFEKILKVGTAEIVTE